MAFCSFIFDVALLFHIYVLILNRIQVFAKADAHTRAIFIPPHGVRGELQFLQVVFHLLHANSVCTCEERGRE